MTLPSDDELISAYVDGQLSGPERAAFEARAQADAALRRRVAATQLLYREARQLPNAAVPRNFILPRDFGQRQVVAEPKRSRFPAWVFRLGSAAAGLVFVSLLAVEVARPAAFSPASLPYSAPVPAEAPAPPAPPAPQAGAAGDVMQATVTLGVLAEGATTNVQPMAATVALPTLDMAQMQTKAGPGASVLSSSEADGAGDATAPEAVLLTATPAPQATLPEIAAGPEVSQRGVFTAPDAGQTQSSEAGILAATPAPQAAPAPAPAAQPEPPVTPLRLLAVVALIAAVLLGALGWLRK